MSYIAWVVILAPRHTDCMAFDQLSVPQFLYLPNGSGNTSFLGMWLVRIKWVKIRKAFITVSSILQLLHRCYCFNYYFILLLDSHVTLCVYGAWVCAHVCTCICVGGSPIHPTQAMANHGATSTLLCCVLPFTISTLLWPLRGGGSFPFLLVVPISNCSSPAQG